VLDGMSAAEAINFEKALRQIQVLATPLARAALPAGAGALGTLVGGPVGTAIGTRLGTLAAGALARPGQGAKVAGGPSVGGGTSAGGSAAAAQGLVLTQQPDVLKALLALSMGQHGARQVGGAPVADVMSMLSSVFGQAAADADELSYLDGAGLGDGEVGDSVGAEPAVGTSWSASSTGASMSTIRTSSGPTARPG
jgi:hypothetical protein